MSSFKVDNKKSLQIIMLNTPLSFSTFHHTGLKFRFHQSLFLDSKSNIFSGLSFGVWDDIRMLPYSELTRHQLWSLGWTSSLVCSLKTRMFSCQSLARSAPVLGHLVPRAKSLSYCELQLGVKHWNCSITSHLWSAGTVCSSEFVRAGVKY